ncbi:MAG: hypothetical protein JO316_25465 [Abitibacteriaceae bacterium]|nr:hypothetical protein [Abditibacteriaceae bacterium]
MNQQRQDAMLCLILPLATLAITSINPAVSAPHQLPAPPPVSLPARSIAQHAAMAERDALRDALYGRMSAKTITNLLKPERHLKDPLKTMLRGQAGAARAIKISEQEKADYELYQRQEAAIYQIGDRKLLPLVADLIPYLDYPAGGLSYLAFDGPEVDIRNRREKCPVADAILKIGKPATPLLQQGTRNSKLSLRLRIMALELLLVLEPRSGHTACQELKQVVERSGDRYMVQYVQLLPAIYG